MNSKQFISAAVLALVGSSVFAADTGAAPASTLTRAEVRAETVRALANHEIPTGEHDVIADSRSAAVATPSRVTRAQVVAELKRAVANHELKTGDIDVYTPPAASQTASPLTRAEVRAQAREWARSGGAHRNPINPINAYDIGG